MVINNQQRIANKQTKTQTNEKGVLIGQTKAKTSTTKPVFNKLEITQTNAKGVLVNNQQKDGRDISKNEEKR